MVESYRKHIVEYFKKNLKKGYTPDALKYSLMSQGYVKTTVERSLEQAQKELAAKAPVLKEKPKIKYEIIDENDNPIQIKSPWWKRFFG